MKVAECIDDPRPWKKRVLIYQGALQLWGRSLITEHTVLSHQKILGWVESLEVTGSEWAAGAHVHQEDTCGAVPVCRAEMEVARGPRGDREAVLTAFFPEGRNNQPTKVVLCLAIW